MCEFSAPWFGASYPDAMCNDGYLHDADADEFDPDDVSHPCPRCNTREFLTERKKHCDSTEWQGWGSGAGMVFMSGDQMWDAAKAWARQESPADADTIIRALEDGASHD